MVEDYDGMKDEEAFDAQVADLTEEEDKPQKKSKRNKQAEQQVDVRLIRSEYGRLLVQFGPSSHRVLLDPADVDLDPGTKNGTVPISVLESAEVYGVNWAERVPDEFGQIADDVMDILHERGIYSTSDLQQKRPAVKMLLADLLGVEELIASLMVNK